MRVKFIFITLTLISCLSALSAQVTLSLPDQEVQQEEVFLLDVSVSNFDSIIGMQFSIIWDKSVLVPIGVENYGLSGLRDNSFGIFEDALTVRWDDQSLEGISLADESTLFTIKFRATAVSDSTIIAFANEPTSIEVIYHTVELSTVTTESGTIRVVDELGTNTTQLQAAPFQVNNNQPNPFTEYTDILIEANAPQDARLIIYDQNGRQVTSLDTRLVNGNNAIRLNAALFPTAGTYYYQLLTDYYATTKKMVVLH
jgi:hypothetical protein